MFFEENQERLAAFVKLSQQAGSRADYVQGGGGNTSVKLSGGLMAIKASGFCLSDIREDNAYAVLNCEEISRFYRENDPKNLENTEKAGAECTKANTLVIPGLEPRRPSVEAGFHSILKTFVLHTHSVYANLVACCVGGRELAAKALSGADYIWGWVDYTDPGATLAFSIRDELTRVEQETGKIPSVILMQNHGIIVHDDDAEKCLAIHADANARLAAIFGMTGNDFPQVSVAPLAGGICVNTTAWLTARLKHCAYSQELLLGAPLYPDQMVFLTDTYYHDRDTISPGQAVANTENGQLVMAMSPKKAMTMAETLTAVFFIMENIEKAGLEVSSMSGAARQFIAGWESEKYRKSLSDNK